MPTSCLRRQLFPDVQLLSKVVTLVVGEDHVLVGDRVMEAVSGGESCWAQVIILLLDRLGMEQMLLVLLQVTLTVTL